MIGGLIMSHGDDAGLRVPPRLAPVQVRVMVARDDEGGGVTDAARKIVRQLTDAGLRVALDDRLNTGFGRRAVEAELIGVPVRVELGPRDLQQGQAVLVRRIAGTKQAVSLDALPDEVAQALTADQQALFDEALERREAATPDVSTLAEAIEAARTGWARIPWSTLGPDGEVELVQHAITVRCLTRPDHGVPDSDDEPDLIAWVARAY